MVDNILPEGLDPRIATHSPEAMALLRKHAKIFGTIDLACGPGWLGLLDELCASLQQLTDHAGAPQVIAVQVKEKLGELRFYAGRVTPAQRALIDATRATASRTCERCGSPGQIYVAEGWYSCACPAHKPEGGLPWAELLVAYEAELAGGSKPESHA